VRLVFAGTPDVAAQHLVALLNSSHDVVAVITRAPAPAGRGRATQPTPVADVARQAGIDVLTNDWQRELPRYAPDCCPVVAFGALIPASSLAQPKFGWVNVHFSRLPRWRGAAPVQWAIRAGDTETGVTVFRIDEGLDTGPILAMRSEAIHPDDTSGVLLTRLAALGETLLVQTMDALESGAIESHAQGSHGVTMAPKINTVDARIDWSASASEIDRLIRSCTPKPGAWTLLDNARMRLGPVRVTDHGGAPGQLSDVGGELLVGTGLGSVALQSVQPEGKRMMPARDWLRGARLNEPVQFT
jgi:methionyl-tRNA formyltransferase